MNEISLQKFGSQYFKHLQEAPFIITSKHKKRWLVLPYSEELMMLLNPTQRVEYKGIPVEIKTDAPANSVYTINTENFVNNNISNSLAVKKSTFINRLRLFLTRKIA